MARPPLLGKVKTRLARDIGQDRALGTYRRLLQSTFEAVGRVPDVDRLLALEEGPAFLPPTGWATLRQEGEGLGARLAEIFARLFAAGQAGALMVGSDSPALPTAYLERAASRLREGSPAVLGPATDGGFYLVGFSRDAWMPRAEELRELLASIPVGTAGAYAHVAEGLERSGVGLDVLPLWVDVDVAADLPLAERLLGTGEPERGVPTRAFAGSLPARHRPVRGHLPPLLQPGGGRYRRADPRGVGRGAGAGGAAGSGAGGDPGRRPVPAPGHLGTGRRGDGTVRGRRAPVLQQPGVPGAGRSAGGRGAGTLHPAPQPRRPGSGQRRTAGSGQSRPGAGLRRSPASLGSSSRGQHRPAPPGAREPAGTRPRALRRRPRPAAPDPAPPARGAGGATRPGLDRGPDGRSPGARGSGGGRVRRDHRQPERVARAVPRAPRPLHGRYFVAGRGSLRAGVRLSDRRGRPRAGGGRSAPRGRWARSGARLRDWGSCATPMPATGGRARPARWSTPAAASAGSRRTMPG